jgi:hypothetical protein
MAEKILYYLGAGASAKALPLARSAWETAPRPNRIPKIKGLAWELANFTTIPEFNNVVDKTLVNAITELRKRCGELAKKANEFGDVDTYAKYLQIMEPGGKNINELKQTVSQYFAVKQTILKARDTRYLPWLVTIMDRKTFPDNVKILSWNYDYQVQLAFNHIDRGEDVSYSSDGFNYSGSALNYYPNLHPNFLDYHTLSLIHLNGIAGFTNKGTTAWTGSVFQKKHSTDIESMLPRIMSSEFNQLHFAWENSGYHDKLMQHVLKMIENTTIMVVIGYSFPFFNRGVDKQIFNELKKNGVFKKIYYQDPVLNGKQLDVQFGLRNLIEIEHINQVDNFHVPFEY